MNLKPCYHEKQPHEYELLFNKYKKNGHKIDLWNAFVDSDLSGITEDDCAIFPRILPASYLPTITKTAYDITLFALRLLSLPENEIKSIVPSGPIRDFLINELQVLKHQTHRITGSFRFDMAIVGPPEEANPPRLLEINEIGFDGLFRSSMLQQSLLQLIPELKNTTLSLDNATAEIGNMTRLGNKLARIQYDSYNWEEEVLVREGKKQKLDVRLISPLDYKTIIDKSDVLLTKEKISFKNNRILVGKNYFPDATQVGFSFELSDYISNESLYRSIVKSKTPQYGPFVTGLVASKMILVLLDDPYLRRKLLGSHQKLKRTLLPTSVLKDIEPALKNNYANYVLKHVDGLGGEMVFMDHALKERLLRIKNNEKNHWVVQKRTWLNKINVEGILSKPRHVIADLGVFVQYDWSNNRFRHFGVGGFISRATNKSFKVNVSGGGIQVPVLFSKNC